LLRPTFDQKCQSESVRASRARYYGLFLESRRLHLLDAILLPTVPTFNAAATMVHKKPVCHITHPNHNLASGDFGSWRYTSAPLAPFYSRSAPSLDPQIFCFLLPRPFCVLSVIIKKASLILLYYTFRRGACYSTDEYWAHHGKEVMMTKQSISRLSSLPAHRIAYSLPDKRYRLKVRSSGTKRRIDEGFGGSETLALKLVN